MKLVVQIWKISKAISRKIRTAVRKSRYQLIIRRQLQDKWQSDCRHLPLTSRHRSLYAQIHKFCWINLNSFPDLIAGESFNDKIHWLKLFSQDPNMVLLTDKLALKQFVVSTLGPDYVPETYQTGHHFADLDISSLPPRAVLKANHDSGSVYFIHDSRHFPLKRYQRRLEKAINRTYGCNGGEWQYWFIQKQLFAEEMLPFTNGAPPPDYKFHCADGKVLWQQHIFDRGRNTKEAITDREGGVMGISFDHHMTPVFEFQVPANWGEMVAVAERLSRGFQYVRVDLYNIDGRIVVGEMTFTPLNGCYQSEGNLLLGRLLPLDRTRMLEPISANFQGCSSRWL